MCQEGREEGERDRDRRDVMSVRGRGAEGRKLSHGEIQFSGDAPNCHEKTDDVPSRSRVQCGCAGADQTPLERFLESPEIPVASPSFQNGP